MTRAIPRNFLRPELSDSFVDIGTISLSASAILEGAADGTLVGLLSVSGVVPQVFSITDNAGGRFAIDGVRLEAGPVVTDYETAASHEITVSAFYGVPKAFTITVTNLVSGTPIGLLLVLTVAE